MTSDSVLSLCGLAAEIGTLRADRGTGQARLFREGAVSQEYVACEFAELTALGERLLDFAECLSVALGRDQGRQNVLVHFQAEAGNLRTLFEARGSRVLEKSSSPRPLGSFGSSASA